MQMIKFALMMQIRTKVFNVLQGTFLPGRIQEYIESDTEGLKCA